MKKLKEKQGITLITLVITLIVFMIIISITIATLTGDSGIIRNAQNSKTQAEINEEYRIVKAAAVSAMNADNMGNITKDNLKYYLDQNIDEKYKIEEAGGNLVVIFDKTEREYVVLDDGEVLYDERDDNGNNINRNGINLELSPNTIPGLGIGETAEIQAITNAIGTITWETSDGRISSIQVQSGDNKRAIITGLSNGSNVISAKVVLEDGSIKEAFCNVTVNADKTIEISRVELDKGAVTIDLASDEKTVQLIATVYPEDANHETNLTWTSSDPSIAAVDENGKVTGIRNGTATITVKTENGKTATCVITVITSPSVIRIEQDKIILDLSINKTEQLIPLIGQEAANVSTGLKWESSSPSIAIVNSSGLVTGVANGTATITAKTENSKTATCEVIVQTSPTRVTLDKTSATLDLSGTKTVQLEATISPSTANVSTGLTWTSSDTSVAAVNNSGLVTGVKNGTATITVETGNGKKATCNIVVETSITKISISPTSATLINGNTLQLTSTIEPSTRTEGVQWISSNTSIATVSSSGLVTAKGSGTVTITLKSSSGKVSATATITCLNLTVSGTNSSYKLTSTTSTYTDDDSCEEKESCGYNTIGCNPFTGEGCERECWTYIECDDYTVDTPGSATISFTLSTYVPASDLTLTASGSNGNISVGSIKVTSSSSRKYSIYLSEKTAYKSDSMKLTLKYKNGTTLYTWNITAY